MKGIIFNLLEEVVTRYHGASAWDGLLDATGLDGAYTSLGSYPDEQVQELVGAAARAFELPSSEVLRWFGREAMPLLAQRYPAFFEGHTRARPFVVSVNSIIHPEVRKLYPGAVTPEFVFSDEGDEGLRMRYQSPRRLCMLAQGFIEGAALHYGERVEFTQSTCMLQGAESCICHMKFVPERTQ